MRYHSTSHNVSGIADRWQLEYKNFKNITKMNKKRNTENKDLTATFGNTMLYAGQTVRLTTSHEEHRGKHFKVIEVLDDLVKVEWQKRIYFFYCTELEVVKSCH